MLNCLILFCRAMSMEDADVSDNQIHQHKDFALLHELNVSL